MATNTPHYNLKKPAGTEDINVNDINGNMDKIDTAIWNTLTYRRTFGASDNLNLLNDEGTGIYTIGNDLPQNAPAGYTWSMLIQIKRTDIFIHQYIIKAEAGAILMREYSGSPQSWGDWKIVCGYTSPVQINYGSNGSYVRYWKSGQTACVKVLYRTSDGAINAWTSKEIAVIPAGFRPVESITNIAAVDRSNDAGTCVNIDSNGSVKISTRYNSFSETGDILQCTFTYPIRY